MRNDRARKCLMGGAARREEGKGREGTRWRGRRPLSKQPYSLTRSHERPLLLRKRPRTGQRTLLDLQSSLKTIAVYGQSVRCGAIEFPFSAAFTATARHAPKKCAEECGALHCFPCLQTNPGCNYFSEITLEPFSLPIGGAQVISSDFATRRWSVATLVAAMAAGPPPYTRDGSESGAMLSRRQSKQIGNRSPLPACPTTCTASLPPSSSCIFPAPCLWSGSLVRRRSPRALPDRYKLSWKADGPMRRDHSTSTQSRVLSWSRWSGRTEVQYARATQCLCYGDRGILDNKRIRRERKIDLDIAKWFGCLSKKKR